MIACQRPTSKHTVLDSLAPVISQMETEKFELRALQIIDGYQGKSKVAVLEFSPLVKDADHLPQVRVYSLGESVTLIGMFSDFFVRLNPSTGEDINGDGLPEIVIERETGGNCFGCQTITIVNEKNGQLNSLADKIPCARIQDLNNDGHYEIVSCSSAIKDEYASRFAHAYVPADLTVLSWSGIKYREQSSSFPAFYRFEIERLSEELAREKDEELYLSKMVSLILCYFHIGECQNGWKTYNGFLKSAKFRSEWWQETTSLITDQLKKEHPCTD